MRSHKFKLEQLDRYIFSVLSAAIFLYGIYQVHHIISSEQGLYYVVVPALKYLITVFLLFANRPAKQIRINALTIVGLILSFGAPVFMTVDASTLTAVAEPLILASFLFYSVVILLALLALGKSFGVFPAIRKTVAAWPFNSIRHPMYASYLHLIALVVIISPSLLNIFLFLLSMVGLFIRAYQEELILKSDPNYTPLIKGVPRRFFSCLFSLPLVVAAISSMATGAPKRSADEVKVLFPYPILSLDPLVYDEWHAVFVGNHIYRRLVAEPARSIPGASKQMTIKCATPVKSLSPGAGCSEIKVLINFERFKDCSGMEVTVDDLKKVFFETLNRMSWIFPNHRKCSDEKYDICTSGPFVADIERRLQNLYLRFGSRNKDREQVVGTGPYCLDNVKKNSDGMIIGGRLKPQQDFNKLPAIIFESTPDNNQFLDLALFGFTKNNDKNRIEMNSHTPLGYYIVSNPGLESQCLPWEIPSTIQVIRDHLYNQSLIFKEANPLLKMLSAGGKKLCANNQAMLARDKFVFILPNFMAGCAVLAHKLELHWRSLSPNIMNARVLCGDTTKLIMDEVVTHKKSWSGFLTPISPGYPGRNAIEVQYFNSELSSSWLWGSRNPEKNYTLVGIGQSNLILNKKRFCKILPSPLGLGDLFITDLIPCE